MEPWQKDFIRKNLLEFVELTKFNKTLEIILLEDKVLNNDDLKQLKAAKDNESGIAQTKLLFDLLVLRENSYKAIGKATFESRQSGAFLLLLKGLVLYLLQQCNINLDEQTLDRILKTECRTDDAWNFFNAKIKKPTIYEENWIPSPHPFYIPRLISNRIKLNPEVFKQKCSDVFVFIGISRSTLSRLVEPNRTAESSEVIVQNTTSVRFVHLEHMEDWDKLQSAWAEPTHLIQYDSCSPDFILLRSTQPSKLVSIHVPPHFRKKSLYVSEDDFITEITNEAKRKPICICDSPGMGKSWLLENLARTAKQCISSHIVCVISLQQFVKQILKPFSENGNECTQYLISYISSFRLTSALLKTALQNNKIQLELFLDGFDEIPKDEVDSTIEFFELIATSSENIRLLITSRPHMRSELEEIFTATTYDILPFSEENQVEFLVKFWQNSATPFKCNPSHLKEFALECLKTFKSHLTELEADIMGIPLQCYLLATVNFTNALMYCRDNSSSISKFIRPTSMYEAYKRYMEICMNKAIETHGLHVNENSASESEERKKLKAFHVWQALELLVPDLAEDYFQTENIFDRKPTAQVLACGILQNNVNSDENSSSITFLHRTFAEYLVAEHFADILTGSRQLSSDELINKYVLVFVQFVLTVQPSNLTLPWGTDLSWDSDDYTDDESFDIATDTKFDSFEFTNNALVYFLNACLHSNQLVVSSEDISPGLKRFLLKADTYKILSACMTSNHANMIRILKGVLENTAKKPSTDTETLQNCLTYPAEINGRIHGFTPDAQYLSHLAYLAHASATSNVKVLEELYSFFENCLHVNLSNVCSTMPAKLVTPLHFALARRDFSLVEFFLNQFTLPGRNALYTCMSSYFTKSLKKYESTIEICKLLLAKDISIISESLEVNKKIVGGVVLVAEDVRCIKFFVEQGADIRATYIQCSYNYTVLTGNAHVMEKSTFSELCQYLIKDVKALDLFKPNLPHWDDPLPRVIGNIDDVSLRCILQIPGIDVHTRDDNGNNLLQIAIMGNGDLNVIQQLVVQGVEVLATGHDGENVLHLACRKGKIDIAEYLLSLGLSLDDKDDFDNLPLHHAIHNFKTLKHIISKNVNILAVNSKNNNICHLIIRKQISNAALKNVMEYFVSLPEAPELFKTRNIEGRTPLQEYLEFYNTTPEHEIIQMLIKVSREDVNVTDVQGNTMLLKAALKRNNLECLKCLVNHGANINATNKDGRNALHITAALGNLEYAQYFVSIGIHMELQDNDGATPLLLAANFQKMNVLKYLISENANVNAVNKNGNNIAHMLLIANCVDNVHVNEGIKYLISLPQGPELFKMRNKNGRTPLHVWIVSNKSAPDDEAMELILHTSGEDVDGTDIESNTMFLCAARNQDSLTCLKCLVKLGTNFNLTDKLGSNALHIAAAFGNLEFVQYFVSIGIQLELQDSNGDTPLLLAAYCQKMDVLKYIISYNGNIFAVDNYGNNIAHLLLLNKSDDNVAINDAIKYLISLPKGPELFKMTNKEQRTPLHVWLSSASSLCDHEDIELILQTSVEDVNGTDFDGDTMFLCATRTQKPLDCLKCLINLGANFNVTNKLGRNALHISAVNGNLEYAQYFVSIGVHTELQDNDGNTPLLLAAYCQKMDVLRYLVSQNANIDAVNRFANNIIHLLLQSKSDDLVAINDAIKYLISLPSGLELYKMTNKRLRTPLHEWVSLDAPCDDKIIEKILQTSGEDVNGTDIDGNTMFLSAATKKDSLQCLKCLKKLGADCNVVNNDGKNAIDLARSCAADNKVVNYLISIGCRSRFKNNCQLV